MKPQTMLTAQPDPPQSRTGEDQRAECAAIPPSPTLSRPVDVRRLAAIDMHGSRGTTHRRRLILAEFVLGATLGPAIAVATLLTAPSAFAGVFGAWLLGASLNYVPLAAYAIALSRPGRLETELAGVDIRAELRLYTIKQFWVAVPLLFVILTAARRRPRRMTRPHAGLFAKRLSGP